MKNKTLIALGLLTTLALPLTVKAGTEMHGGDSVVCFQNLAQKQKVEAVLRQNKMAAQMGYIRQDPFSDIDMNTVTVETLDVFETRQSTSPEREFIEVTNPTEGVKERIKVLNTKISSLAAVMETALNGFYAPSKWLASTTGIVEIDDSHELINYTKSCIPVQIAVQTETRVYYDGRLYAKLDEVNKTALILHELMYSWVKNFSDNSFNVRKYVGLLMLKEFETYNAEELHKEMAVDFKKDFHIWIPCKTSTTFQGVELNIDFLNSGLNFSICEEEDNRNPIDGVKFDSKSYEALSNKIGLKIKSIFAGSEDDNYVYADRYESQKDVKNIVRLHIVDGQPYKVATATEFEATSVDLKITASKGKIFNAFPKYARNIKILGQSIEVNHESSLEYKDTVSGKKYLASFKLAKAAKLSSVSGFRKMKQCDEYSHVVLNAQGLVESCK